MSHAGRFCGSVQPGNDDDYATFQMNAMQQANYQELIDPPSVPSNCAAPEGELPFLVLLENVEQRTGPERFLRGIYLLPSSWVGYRIIPDSQAYQDRYHHVQAHLWVANESSLKPVDECEMCHANSSKYKTSGSSQSLDSFKPILIHSVSTHPGSNGRSGTIKYKINCPLSHHSPRSHYRVTFTLTHLGTVVAQYMPPMKVFVTCSGKNKAARHPQETNNPPALPLQTNRVNHLEYNPETDIPSSVLFHSTSQQVPVQLGAGNDASGQASSSNPGSDSVFRASNQTLQYHNTHPYTYISPPAASLDFSILPRRQIPLHAPLIHSISRECGDVNGGGELISIAASGLEEGTRYFVYFGPNQVEAVNYMSTTLVCTLPPAPDRQACKVCVWIYHENDTRTLGRRPGFSFCYEATDAGAPIDAYDTSSLPLHTTSSTSFAYQEARSGAGPSFQTDNYHVPSQVGTYGASHYPGLTSEDSSTILVVKTENLSPSLSTDKPISGSAESDFSFIDYPTANDLNDKFEKPSASRASSTEASAKQAADRISTDITSKLEKLELSAITTTGAEGFNTTADARARFHNHKDVLDHTLKTSEVAGTTIVKPHPHQLSDSLLISPEYLQDPSLLKKQEWSQATQKEWLARLCPDPMSPYNPLTPRDSSNSIIAGKTLSILAEVGAALNLFGNLSTAEYDQGYDHPGTSLDNDTSLLGSAHGRGDTAREPADTQNGLQKVPERQVTPSIQQAEPAKMTRNSSIAASQALEKTSDPTQPLPPPQPQYYYFSGSLVAFENSLYRSSDQVNSLLRTLFSTVEWNLGEPVSEELLRPLCPRKPSETAGEYLFQCLLCDATVEQVTLALEHIEKHLCLKRFACDVEDCRMTFTRQIELRNHKATHEVCEEVFCPNACGARFVGSKNVYRHLKTSCKNKPTTTISEN